MTTTCENRTQQGHMIYQHRGSDLRRILDRYSEWFDSGEAYLDGDMI